MRAASSRAWPRIMSGPAQNPRRALSLIVTVNTGPGIMAPENATAKEEINIPARLSKDLQHNC